MKRAWPILATALMLMISGCGSQSGTAGSDSGSEGLTVALGGQITTLDPGLSQETVNDYILRHTTAGLFHTDENGQTVNDLCQDYTVSEDGLTYTFTLRSGVQWSDGQPLTSDDFEYAIIRNLTYGADNAWSIYYPSTYLAGAAEIAGNSDLDPTVTTIEGVETPDDSTLVLHLTKPCAWFIQMLTNDVWRPLRADFADAHDSLWSLEAGYPSVGPYLLQSCNENERAVIVKNENYYNADEVVMPQITFLVMTDADAQALAFQNNETDIALNITATLAESYSNPEELWNVPQISSYFIALNSGESGPAYLDDVNVRRALALAIDKEALVAAIGSEDYYRVLHGYVPYGLNGATSDFREEQDAVERFLEYDPETARQLLAQAGYDESNPLSITYKYSQSVLHADVAQILQQMWEAVGIQCELQVVESGVFYNQIDNGDFELARYGYSSGDDPSQFLNLWTTGQQIVAAVDDPVYDQMVDEASYLVDHTEYMNAMHAAERYLIQEQVYLIPLFNYNTPALQKTSVQGVEMWGLVPYYGKVTLTA